jgi:hypothetical protein
LALVRGIFVFCMTNRSLIVILRSYYTNSTTV